jgi:hypothetical protein
MGIYIFHFDALTDHNIALLLCVIDVALVRQGLFDQYIQWETSQRGTGGRMTLTVPGLTGAKEASLRRELKRISEVEKGVVLVDKTWKEPPLLEPKETCGTCGWWDPGTTVCGHSYAKETAETDGVPELLREEGDECIYEEAWEPDDGLTKLERPDLSKIALDMGLQAYKAHTYVDRDLKKWIRAARKAQESGVKLESGDFVCCPSCEEVVEVSCIFALNCLPLRGYGVKLEEAQTSEMETMVAEPCKCGHDLEVFENKDGHHDVKLVEPEPRRGIQYNEGEKGFLELPPMWVIDDKGELRGGSRDIRKVGDRFVFQDTDKWGDSVWEITGVRGARGNWIYSFKRTRHVLADVRNKRPTDISKQVDDILIDEFQSALGPGTCLTDGCNNPAKWDAVDKVNSDLYPLCDFHKKGLEDDYPRLHIQTLRPKLEDRVLRMRKVSVYALSDLGLDQGDLKRAVCRSQARKLETPTYRCINPACCLENLDQLSDSGNCQECDCTLPDPNQPATFQVRTGFPYKTANMELDAEWREDMLKALGVDAEARRAVAVRSAIMAGRMETEEVVDQTLCPRCSRVMEKLTVGDLELYVCKGCGNPNILVGKPQAKILCMSNAEFADLIREETNVEDTES